MTTRYQDIEREEEKTLEYLKIIQLDLLNFHRYRSNLPTTETFQIKVSGNLRMQRTRPKGLRFRISYKSPIFKKSNFAYIQGHDAKSDLQINFYFKSEGEDNIRNLFNSLKMGTVYEITRFLVSKSEASIFTVEVLATTKITEAMEEINKIPNISPMIAEEKITFSHSINELKKDEFCSIIGRVLGLSNVFQRKDGTVIRGAKKILFELSTREITGVCLWEERHVDLDFKIGSYVIFRNLQRVAGLYDLKCTFCTSILLHEDFGDVPQMLSFTKVIPSQDSEPEIMTIGEMNDDQAPPYLKGEFIIQTILTDQLLRYPKCIHCSKKTKQLENNWVCESNHISENPIYTYRLRALALDQTENYKRISFFGEKGEKLLGEDAKRVPEWERQHKYDLVTEALKRVEGKLFFLRITNTKNEKYSEWIADEILSLNE